MTTVLLVCSVLVDIQNKNVDGRSTSSHDNMEFRNRSMEIQRGMAFGLRKAATVVNKTGWMDGRTDR